MFKEVCFKESCFKYFLRKYICRKYVVRNYVFPKSYFCCDLKPQAKFGNPKITRSGRKVTTSEEREREIEKNAVNSGHLVP